MAQLVKKAWNKRSEIDCFIVTVVILVVGTSVALPTAVALDLHTEVQF